MTPLLDVDPPPTPVADDEGSSDSDSSSDPPTALNSPSCSWLQTFHFVLVLDLPDPSSSASGNVSKYLDIIYEHIAFTVTAVLYQEQVLSNYVEQESDTLLNLKDQYASRGERFADYVEHALRVSALAQAMKNLYEAIKAGVIANITIHDLPLELQLPPYLDSLLHSTSYDDYDDDFVLEYQQHEESFFGTEGWAKELGFAWRLPTLAPWKSLLLLDDGDHGDENAFYADLITGQDVIPEDRQLAEQLIKFLEITSITLSYVFSLLPESLALTVPASQFGGHGELT
jgi:nitrogen permease regulator 3-like protein